MDAAVESTLIPSYHYGMDFEPVMEAVYACFRKTMKILFFECQDGVMMVMTTLLEEVTVEVPLHNKGENMGSTSYGMSCNGNQFVTKKFRGGCWTG
jgi:hypothetical protein